MKPLNPFLLKTYHSPAYFCNRDKETQLLIETLLNGQDVTLFSLRRMGKTGLLHHVGYYMEKKHGYSFIYTDLLGTESTAEMVEKMANSVISQLFPHRSWVQKMGEIFRSFQPRISYDAITGEPDLTFGFSAAKQAWKTLDELFSYIAKSKLKIYWAMDEFQQVNRYAESEQVEANLRAWAQKLNHVRFVFSGSQKNMLMAMFTQANRPFYQSTRNVYLKEIATKEYVKFIRKYFKPRGIGDDVELIQEIMEYTLGHTWYVQVFCHRLYMLGDELTPEVYRKTCSDILTENEHYYFRYRQLLSGYQWSLLKAIAMETKVFTPNGGEFIRRYKLNSAAAVNRALKSLLDMEMIDKIDNGDGGYYRLNDVFLMRWIQAKYNAGW